jgi:antitoxin HicB
VNFVRSYRPRSCPIPWFYKEAATNTAGRTGIGEKTQTTIHTKFMSKKNHRGSDFRDFLKEQDLLDEVEAGALKQAMSLQIRRLLEEKSLTKAEMAARMKTSRAAVDRLLDASNSSITLNTLGKAARALGRKVKIELVPA